MAEVLAIETIVSDPNVRGGQPVIAGTHITVADVAAAARFKGMTPAQIADALTLTLADVHAALAFYYAHQPAIDAIIRAERDRAEALRDMQTRRAWLESLKPQIADFCRRWQIVEFALFGSVLTEDFRPDSDIDVLVTFAPEAAIGWRIFDAQEELKDIFGRKVDLTTRGSIEKNASRLLRDSVTGTIEVLYAAA